MTPRPDLSSYQYIVVAFSGGKDSLACLLHLIEQGVNMEKLELWHHEVDGREGPRLMDWPVTPDYCRKIADHFDLPLYASWRVGGFEREMLRENAATAAVRYEVPDGEIREAGGNSRQLGTRLKFPQVSADLRVRWCSGKLKIDVADAALRGQDHFLNARTLFITGERREESPARARYAVFEPHRTDTRNGTRRRRHVDHWRPILDWPEQQVWASIERHRINPHPAYWLGEAIGRCSCEFCIFASNDQLATIRWIDPAGFQRVADYEASFGWTIHRTLTLTERADRGTPSPELDLHRASMAMSNKYTAPVILDPWQLPPGAYGDATGPT